jgi:hypothetical protein
MPNARAHAVIGTGAGGLVAFLWSRDLPPEARFMMTLGGGLAGYAGGRLPDVLEPAIHAWHRSFFHSAAVGAGVFHASVAPIKTWVDDLLTKAAGIRARRLQLGPDHPESARLSLQEFGLYFLCGLAIGLPVGYLSHVVADAGTERSIPFIGT